MATHISPKDTSSALRQALKEKFKGVKFSVQTDTYSMGASSNVDWTDGPSVNEVRAIADQFLGSDFDGMIDLKTIRVSIWNGQEVAWGVDAVHLHRDYTLEPYTQVARDLAAKYGKEMPEIKQTGRPSVGRISWVMPDGTIEEVCDLIHREIRDRSFYKAPEKAKKPTQKAAPKQAPVPAAPVEVSWPIVAADGLKTPWTDINPLGKTWEKAEDVSVSLPKEASPYEIIVVNEATDGVELYIEKEVELEVQDFLEMGGFHWSAFNGCWWAKRNTASLTTAKVILCVYIQLAKRIKEKMDARG